MYRYLYNTSLFIEETCGKGYGDAFKSITNPLQECSYLQQRILEAFRKRSHSERKQLNTQRQSSMVYASAIAYKNSGYEIFAVMIHSS